MVQPVNMNPANAVAFKQSQETNQEKRLQNIEKELKEIKDNQYKFHEADKKFLYECLKILMAFNAQISPQTNDKYRANCWEKASGLLQKELDKTV